MRTPVFKHIIERVSEALEDEKAGLRSILSLMKYDPGLFSSVMQKCQSRHGYEEVSTMRQAGPLLGIDTIRRLMTEHTLQLDDPDSIMLWHIMALSGEAAMRINQRIPVADDEEAFFAGIMPFAGMTLMIAEKPEYRRLIPLLIKLSMHDRVYLENSLFGIDHISILGREQKLPEIYRDVLQFIMQDRFPSSLRASQNESVSRYSMAYEAVQLYRISTSAEYIAKAILFPFVVLAEEIFKRINKRFFSISENESEDLLTDILENYEAVCRNFGQEEMAAQLIDKAIQYKAPESKFLTSSPPLLRTLNKLFEDRHLENNIAITGEPGVGKRLLSMALHYHPSNPRRQKPFLSFHCDTLERETLEEELLGVRGGYWGKDQHKGAFDIADGGVIMLKDINTMPLPLQERLAEIISLIDYHRARKITGKQPDVLFIVTSRPDLEDEARQGRFSKALLRALKPVQVKIPPLRERREDIGLIADGIIKKYQLPLQKTQILLRLHEIYEKDAFEENLSGLKRILFNVAAKELLKSQVLN
jgi:transcriptional regulator with AAA-type ATPase domain